MKMKRIILTLTMLVALVATASAQAEIKFDKLIHNFGSFEESNPVQKATFTFTNVGNKPLIINQAIASCGCTVPSYTKKPIAPGEKGQISVIQKMFVFTKAYVIFKIRTVDLLAENIDHMVLGNREQHGFERAFNRQGGTHVPQLEERLLYDIFRLDR